MGNCWSATLPEEDESYDGDSKTLGRSERSARKVVEFGKEELKLDELLASLRTGLVFAPTEFSVLPGGLNTTGRVTFTIGNSELQRRQEASILKEKSEQDDQTPDSQDESASVEPEPFKLKVTLEGHGWVKGLVMTLGIQPVVGPFARHNIEFHWREDILEVVGCKQGEMEAHSLPLSFETEVEFCICCLQLMYQNKSRNMLERTGEDIDNAFSSFVETGVPSLQYSAYKTAVANLDRVSVNTNTNLISAKLQHTLFGIQDPVSISITLWPKAYNSGATLLMKIKAGIVFGELTHLIKERLQLCNDVLKLYYKQRPVHMNEVVSSYFNNLDCFVVAQDNKNAVTSLCLDEESPAAGTEAEIVVSLIGKEIQSMEVNLDMPMKEFDILVRKTFNLSNDNFLIILAEDDLAPQYMADDNWKCTYPFSIPDNSFGAGLRRSFRRLSTRRQGNRSRPHTPSSEGNMSVFAPHMAEVIELLSSDQRRFPRNGSRCGLSIEELYKSMPLYSLSVEQCGIHPYSVIQVFEVTGPSIPITVRVLSDYSHVDRQVTSQAPHTRLANIMDINPEWSINTFFQYIDAVVSLSSSSSRQKQLLLRDNSLNDKDLSSLTLGALLDHWKPLWWAEKGHGRRQLTSKDIDPSEYLIVEKF